MADEAEKARETFGCERCVAPICVAGYTLSCYNSDPPDKENLLSAVFGVQQSP